MTSWGRNTPNRINNTDPWSGKPVTAKSFVAETITTYIDEDRRPLTLEEIKTRLDKQNLIGSFPSNPVVWMGKYNFDWSVLESVVDECMSKVRRNSHLEQGNAKSTVNLANDSPQDQPHKRKELKEFTDWLYNKILYVASQWDYPENTPYRCFNSWFNEHYRGGRTESHTHNLCNFVVSSYLKVPENSGAILFRDPMYETRSMEPNTVATPWRSYPVKTGDVLIFPGWLEHMVEPSESDERRVVMTMNWQVDHHQLPKPQ